MQKKSLEIHYHVYESIQQLSAPDSNLMFSAQSVAKTAYAPYSNFRVGCAVLMENGKIVSGNNQENMAYPSGLCAERVAVFYAKSQYPDVKIHSIAIATCQTPENTGMLTPCGACRQVLSEYESVQLNPIRLLLLQPSGQVWVFDSIAAILPFSFQADSLNNR